jgi:enoyl-CoA hydratase
MIHREDRGDVAILRMERGRANAIDIELCAAFSTELDNLQKQNVRSVVLTSKGSIFSAGVDLVRLVDGGRSYVEKFLPAFSEMVFKLFTFPRPVIAAINGHAIAGGFILACACDVRIMVEGTGQIGMPELLVGVPLPSIVIEVLRFAVPTQHLAQLAYFGRLVEPTEGLRLGMLEEVVPEKHLLGHAFRIANQMAAIADGPFLMTKHELRAPFVERFEAQRARVDAEVLSTWCASKTLDLIKTYIARTLRKNPS